MYRVRIILAHAVIAIMLITAVASFLPTPQSLLTALSAASYAALTLAAIFLAVCAFGRPHRPTQLHLLHPPVRGRWLAANSPATKIPSHGVRMYGQSHAIDLVAWPEESQVAADYPTTTGMLPADQFPGQGRPVLAMVDGVVVNASDWQWDHRSRTSRLSHVYLAIEQTVRTMGGPHWIFGNHVTIRADDGTFAVVAHIRRRSLRVQVGDRVKAGDLIADCGNSGNSTEPHVHAQLMDRQSLWLAHGLPMGFRHAEILPTDEDTDLVETDTHVIPANGQLMITADSS
ncbi:M23 family metallopeptidase [Brevibacterium sp. FME37]|uniref:M23 family metallopeptidase n=1 Tax=Brevibacterium sp. FME37 TaxID=2742607 RepID=UPI0018660E25|nr:M23 family metallopeptidase [Brevibacterium sp. FME37]